MELTSTERHLKNIAFGLGLIQGFSYVILAFVCLVMHNQPMRDFTNPGYMELVNSYIYTLFIAPDDGTFLIALEKAKPFRYALRPKIFTGFAWTYFFLHLFWFGVSVVALRRKEPTPTRLLATWSYSTFLTSAWDFVTVVILGSDYRKCLSWAEDSQTVMDLTSIQAFCATGFLPVMVIAAKGFTLWFVNVIFGVFLYFMALRLRKLKRGDGFPQQSSTQITSGTDSQTPRYASSTSHNMNRNRLECPVEVSENDDYYI